MACQTKRGPGDVCGRSRKEVGDGNSPGKEPREPRDPMSDGEVNVHWVPALVHTSTDERTVGNANGVGGAGRAQQAVAESPVRWLLVAGRG